PYAFPTVPTALYNLEHDVGETTDVSADYPEVVARLDALAELARESLGDELTEREGSEVRPAGQRGFERSETVTHIAVGTVATLTTPPSSRYPGLGAASLTDGMVGSRNFNDRRWLGFEGGDMEATVDLREPRVLHRIGVDCLQSQTSWIFYPKAVEFAVSTDGIEWNQVGATEILPEPDPRPESRLVAVDIPPRAVRYVRVRALNVGLCPDWHVGAGGESWLFVDEIVVE
ncbi:discoidin domain-containing protein, partial [Gemmatimonadota bacterium]